MNRLLLVLILVVAGVIGLGFYQKWFRLSSDNADDKTHITVTVDKDKIQEDKKKVEDKVHDLGHKAKDQAATPAEKGKDQAAPPPGQE
jgi:hypothetical protein